MTVLGGHLAELCASARRLTVEAVCESGAGHLGGSLSAVDIITTIHFGLLESREVSGRQSDKFVLSKGHAEAAYYAALSLAGRLPRQALGTMRKFGSVLQGHPDRRFLRDVTFSSGSLGQGLSFAAGLACCGAPHRFKVFCLLGDGELQEGQVWEAALFCVHKGLTNLIVFVDCNAFQLSSAIPAAQTPESMASAWTALGWSARIVDGHDPEALLAAGRGDTARPSAIFCRTVKGKGIPFAEGNNEYHGRPLTDEEAAGALRHVRK